MNSDQARQIVDRMLSGDLFSRWLGIICLETAPGRTILQMEVRPEMVNGFGIAHGGITYSLADSALAFASNGHGRQCLSIETSINHIAKVSPGDILRAEAVEESRNEKTGLYIIRIFNQHQEAVALFKGLVYRSSRIWDIREEI